MAQLEYIINEVGTTATVRIHNLLSTEDHDEWFDGNITEDVQRLQDAFSDEGADDFQIWEEGNAFVNDVNVEAIARIATALGVDAVEIGIY